jgi:predicted amidohydrolase
MTDRIIAACLQVNSGPVIAENFARIEPMIEKAQKRGASFIALPECTDVMVADKAKLREMARGPEDHPAIQFFSMAAKKYNAWILAGSVAVRVADGKLANRSYLFAANGTITAHYDKIHMFNADLSSNECYRESERFTAGDKAVIATSPWGKIGMTICYDVRFPHLYRTLAKAGAGIITVPAAFAMTTGRLHWHTLLRARAIETGSFVIAPGQCGTHDGGRQTYGHSLIIAPSGRIITEANGNKPEVIIAEIDMAEIAETRRMLPCLQHDREFVLP